MQVLMFLVLYVWLWTSVLHDMIYMFSDQTDIALAVFKLMVQWIMIQY